jgi:hypothetical protein
MTTRNHDDWLTAFVKHASIGEAPLIYYGGLAYLPLPGPYVAEYGLSRARFNGSPTFISWLSLPQELSQRLRQRMWDSDFSAKLTAFTSDRM